MALYIDKDAILAKIEKELSYYKDLEDRGIISEAGIAAYRVIRLLKSDIDSLEVKEVDLEKEITHYFKGWGNNEIHCFAMMEDGTSVGINECIDIAEHFFELGMQVSNKE